MKEWIICEYGYNHIQSPYECKPVGVAVQKTMGDDDSSEGFVLITEFEKWLRKEDKCAFGIGYFKNGKYLSKTLPKIEFSF